MGTPLTEYILPKRLDVGISIEPEFPGMVPEYECREAAVYVGATWYDWINHLSSWDRASAVAHYRLQLQIKAHVDDAAHKASERDVARRKRS